MQGKLYTAVWPYKIIYYIGVVLFVDMKKNLRWTRRCNVARKTKESAKKDAEDLRKQILSL